MRAQPSSRCTIRLASTSKVAPASLGRSVVHASTQPDGSATRSPGEVNERPRSSLTFVSPHTSASPAAGALSNAVAICFARFLTKSSDSKCDVATWSGGPSAGVTVVERRSRSMPVLLKGSRRGGVIGSVDPISV